MNWTDPSKEIQEYFDAHQDKIAKYEVEYLPGNIKRWAIHADSVVVFEQYFNLSFFTKKL